MHQKWLGVPAEVRAWLLSKRCGLHVVQRIGGDHSRGAGAGLLAEHTLPWALKMMVKEPIKGWRECCVQNQAGKSG